MRITIYRRGLLPMMLTAAVLAPRAALAADDAALLLLPPAYDGRVLVYHSFSKGAKKPELNTAKATVEAEGGAVAEGFTGRGLALRPAKGANSPQSIRLVSPAFSAHRPLTVMLWWRVDAPMRETTWLGLLKIGNHRGRHDGYIANFVAGKGEWCGLKEPTYISQLQNFPGLTDRNMPWGGRVWSEPGQWRHLAMTLSGARQVDIYWDGRHREMFQAKGRLFVEGDTNALIVGPEWHQFPMTIDEIVVLDRALSAEEIADHRRACLAIQAIGSGQPVRTAPVR